MRKKHLLYIAVLSVMLSVTLVGSALLSQASATRGANVVFSPDTYTWGQPPPNPWKVYVGVGWYTWQIVSSSIRLEGVLAPVKTRNYWLFLVAYFDGDAIASILGSKIDHDGVVEPGTYHVELTVSGKLTDGTSFSGTGIITVTVPNSELTCERSFEFPAWEQKIVNGTLRMELTFIWSKETLSITAKINDDDYAYGDYLMLIFDTNGDGALDGGQILYAANATLPVVVVGNNLAIPPMSPQPSLFHTCTFKPTEGYTFDFTIPISLLGTPSDLIYLRYRDNAKGNEVYVSFHYKVI